MGMSRVLTRLKGPIRLTFAKAGPYAFAEVVTTVVINRLPVEQSQGRGGVLFSK
jgi:hypothetical protein